EARQQARCTGVPDPHRRVRTATLRLAGCRPTSRLATARRYVPPRSGDATAWSGHSCALVQRGPHSGFAAAQDEEEAMFGALPPDTRVTPEQIRVDCFGEVAVN